MASNTPAISGSRPKVNPWLVAIAAMLPTMMEVLDTSVVNVSLPHIGGSLAATATEATWVLTSYLVSNAIVLPITGWLSNYVGRKRLLLSTVTGFTLASLVCGLAPNLTVLILARVVQGATGGGLQPLSQAVLLEEFPVEKRGVAMAFWGMGIVTMPILGPIIGGWLTDAYSWRWVFFINLPIGILSLILLQMYVFDPSYIRRAAARVDLWGLGFLALWIACMQVVLDKGQQKDWIGSDFITVLLVLSAIGLVAFVVRELMAKDPIVHLRLLKYRTFSAGLGVMVVIGFTLYGGLVALPLFLQVLLGYTAFTSGLLTSPRGIGTMIFMPLAGYLLNRQFDARKMMTIGLVIGGIGLLAFARMTLSVGPWFVIWIGVLFGCGLGFLFVPLTTASMDPIPLPEMGYATSIFNLVRNVGGSIGIAFTTTMIARRSQFHQNVLSAHILPGTPDVRAMLAQAQALLIHGGLSPANALHAAQALLYNQLLKQSLYFSYIDVFYLFGIIFFAGIPLLWIMKRPKARKAAPGMH